MSKLQIGEQLRRRRVLALIQQQDVAKESGVHPSWLSRIERGIVNPSADEVSRITEALDRLIEQKSASLA